MLKTVTLILPATDEPESLKKTVEQCIAILTHYELEFVIVTSPKLTTAGCRAAIIELQRVYGGRIETFDQKEPGLGCAIREALERADGDVTVIMSADLETDPAALPAMLQKIEEGYDIAVTSRWRGGVHFRGYSPVKLILNFGFQQLFRLLYWTRLSDLTYAYRAYRTEILKKIRWEEAKFPFLFESIVKPLRLGYRVAEVRAPWSARVEGASHNSFTQTLDYTRVGLSVRFQNKKSMLVR